jgi:hypothetical protein
VNALLAVGPVAGWTFGDILIAIVVIAAVCAVAFVALRHFGIQIPAFVAQIFWICVCAVVAVLAIRFLLSL